MIVEFYFFQFVDDELYDGAGFGYSDAPPVAEVLVGGGAIGPVELSEECFESFWARGLALFAEPPVWPGERDFWALAGTENEASLVGCLL